MVLDESTTTLTVATPYPDLTMARGGGWFKKILAHLQ